MFSNDEVDSDISWLTVGANTVSVSLLQCIQIVDKDAVLKFYKLGLVLQVSDMLAYSTVVMIKIGQCCHRHTH